MAKLEMAAWFNPAWLTPSLSSEEYLTSLDLRFGPKASDEIKWSDIPASGRDFAFSQNKEELTDPEGNRFTRYENTLGLKTSE